MSNGGIFFVIILGVICLGLFCFWLYTKWQMEYGEDQREKRAMAEFPLFGRDPEPMRNQRSINGRISYRNPDWDRMARNSRRLQR